MEINMFSLILERYIQSYSPWNNIYINTLVSIVTEGYYTLSDNVV